MSHTKEPEIPVEIAELLARTPKVTEAMQARLAAAAEELDHDSGFQEDFIKGHFVNSMLEAMGDEGLSQSEVARKWGRSRQYLHKLLNEDKRVNFTVETMVELAMLLKRRLELHVFKECEAAHVLRCVVSPPPAVPESAMFPRRETFPYSDKDFIPFHPTPPSVNDDRISA